MDLIKAERKDYEEQLQKLKNALKEANCVVIGAGAGLSTSAGFTYSGERFEKYFSDFKKRYGFSDMYSGGFFPYEKEEEFWGFWCRNIYVNRYMNDHLEVYRQLYELIRDKDYFVITTNVDHCFQKTGFDKKRLYYTQGDYGLFQCSKPCHNKTYDNKNQIIKMIEYQGYIINQNGDLNVSDNTSLKMEISSDLIPKCPVCGEDMTTNLRVDDGFVEDEGWHQASERYTEFLRRHSETKILFLELGVGFNTPGIIKIPFIRMCEHNKEYTYACINYDDVYISEAIAKQAICISEDIGKVISDLLIR